MVEKTTHGFLSLFIYFERQIDEERETETSNSMPCSSKSCDSQGWAWLSQELGTPRSPTWVRDLRTGPLPAASQGV